MLILGAKRVYFWEKLKEFRERGRRVPSEEETASRSQQTKVRCVFRNGDQASSSGFVGLARKVHERVPYFPSLSSRFLTGVIAPQGLTIEWVNACLIGSSNPRKVRGVQEISTLLLFLLLPGPFSSPCLLSDVETNASSAVLLASIPAGRLSYCVNHASDTDL